MLYFIISMLRNFTNDSAIVWPDIAPILPEGGGGGNPPQV